MEWFGIAFVVGAVLLYAYSLGKARGEARGHKAGKLAERQRWRRDPTEARAWAKSDPDDSN